MVPFLAAFTGCLEILRGYCRLSLSSLIVLAGVENPLTLFILKISTSLPGILPTPLGFLSHWPGIFRVRNQNLLCGCPPCQVLRRVGIQCCDVRPLGSRRCRRWRDAWSWQG